MIRRGWSWYIDYVYVAFWQVRHFFSRGVPEEFASGSLPPVLVLPGVYETWQFLRPIARTLNERGHPVHVVRELGYNRATIPDSAAVAQRYLDEHGLNDVILVAHSKGGLIGKHMMLFNDTDRRISQLVAIATPFGGSIYARFFLNRAVRAFSPSDPVLQLLAANVIADARITSIYGEFDPHIPAGSRLEGATNVLLPVTGHFKLLGTAAVEQAVVTAIGMDAASRGVD